ncbi:MAG TPA: GAF domain-containing protein [Solirubrobacteraceae bacterium]
MDASAIEAAAAATSSSYRSFADATRSVLDLLERHMPEAGIYLAHLDRGQHIHRIVDTRSGMQYGLRSNLAIPLDDSLCAAMALDRAPRRCGDVPRNSIYRDLPMQTHVSARSYLGVPLELSDGTRVGSLCALSREKNAFDSADEQLFTMLARVLASELERESNERDLRRFNDLLRDQARGMGAVGRVARALAAGEDARTAVCEAACDVMAAPAAFLLEPSGREFVSTAMSGMQIQPVTIQPRGEGAGAGRAFTSHETYFVADARHHPALAPPLVEATGARSAVFEPVLRDGEVSGVLIVIWQAPLEALPDAPAGALRLVAAQAAVAIEHAALRGRMAALAMTDQLTGLMTRRVFEEELPRELARARRSDTPVSVAVLDLDHMEAFNTLRSEREGDRLIKETAARWRAELREVDVLSRLDGVEFGVVLPGCALSEAVDVLDRVRGATPRGQTASAGVARWDDEEPAELLMTRAADALAAAKSSGRNITIAAD